VGWWAFWAGISKSVGCTLVGGGSAVQSFTGLGNSAPGPNDVVRPIQEGYRIAVPTLAYLATKYRGAGVLGDTIPFVGQLLLASQVGLAAKDGAQDAYTCTPK